MLMWLPCQREPALHPPAAPTVRRHRVYSRRHAVAHSVRRHYAHVAIIVAAFVLTLVAATVR